MRSPSDEKKAPVFAAIDLGSNTVRLLVAVPGRRGPLRILSDQQATRLSEGLLEGRTLYSEAVERTRRVVFRFSRIIAEHNVTKALIGGTMAVRQASNGSDFLKKIEAETGIETRLLSGFQEAEVTAAGVLTSLDPLPEKALIFDLGGKSTEFALARGTELVEALSLPMGSVGLTEKYIRSDPPRSDEIRAMRDEIRNILRKELPEAMFSPGGPVVGTAGTVTTLAAMLMEMTEYDPDRVNNFRIDRDVLDSLFDKLIMASTKNRAAMPGLPKDRADIIVAGAAVVLEIMHLASANHLIVSDAGLLEGIWLVAAGLKEISLI